MQPPGPAGSAAAGAGSGQDAARSHGGIQGVIYLSHQGRTFMLPNRGALRPGLLPLPMQHGSSSSDGAQARAPFYTNI